MATTSEIEAKVEVVERRRVYIDRCVSAYICPNCGESLTQDDWGNGFDIVCIPCGKDVAVKSLFLCRNKIVRQPKIWGTVC